MDKIPGGRGPKTVRLSRVYHLRRASILVLAALFLIVPFAVGWVVTATLRDFMDHGIRAPARIVSQHRNDESASGRRRGIEKTTFEYAVGRGRFQKSFDLSAAQRRELLEAGEAWLIVMKSDPETVFFGELDDTVIQSRWVTAIAVSMVGLVGCGGLLAILVHQARRQREVLASWTPCRAHVLSANYAISVWPHAAISIFSNLTSVSIRYSLDQRSYATALTTRRDVTPGRGTFIFVNPDDPEDVVLAHDCVLVEYVPSRYK